MNRDGLILQLMRTKGMSLQEAEAFVEDLDVPEEEPEPAQRQRQRGAWEAGDTFEVRKGSEKVASRFIVAQRGSDGLTASQREGLERGARLCPNCQQPEDDHIPACLRDPKNGFREDERRRVVTKSPLAPSS